MKLTAEDLPASERKIWEKVRTLPEHEKKTLWQMIKHTNKDHLCLVQVVTTHAASLEEKGLLVKNNAYRGKKGQSYYVLRTAPHLMKKLQGYANRPSPLL
ncbi:hypothetical protein [Alkalicoccus halolimnae]|uniref:Uncharacterized protein n=1 Tax=Alkalicoccus halolimnae TaxID=1667239 RepID=A0A5C7F2E3_9BACI|nr:hypothetical protein [Alkalicoccus halolimnae]TXF81315.1 hypothetical protein FTX54_15990 [Alkalicoccus halolimnae]